MAIRTKEYRFKAGGNRRVRAIRITEKNFIEISSYINRNGGQAEALWLTLKSGDVANHRIRIKQMNHMPKGSKRDWRLARVGDFIVKYEDDSFARVKDDVFEAEFVLTK